MPYGDRHLLHIQQVFALVAAEVAYQGDQNTDRDPFVVNVYLGPGTHYLYTCNIEPGARACGEDYCSAQVVPFYQASDNVVFNFLPLRDGGFDDTKLKEHMDYAYDNTDASQTALRTTYSWANSEAAAKAGRDSWYVPAGEYPTIAVMDNEVNFNITRGATFTDIIFRGDYGMV